MRFPFRFAAVQACLMAAGCLMIDVSSLPSDGASVVARSLEVDGQCGQGLDPAERSQPAECRPPLLVGGEL